MKTLLTIVLTLTALGVLAAAVVWSGTYNVAADAPHARPVHVLLETMRERSIETRSADIAPPDLDRAELISSGAGNYDAMCAGCHLSPGANESELSRGLYPAPPNLSNVAIDDPADAFWAIKHGIKASGMPAWGKSMEDEYIWGLVAFLRRLPGMDADAYEKAVATSKGHSHGGGAVDHSHEGGEHHEHGETSDDHHAGKTEAEPAVHTHADGKQHVHRSGAISPLDTAKLFHESLASGDADKVKALLDPHVLVLESGGAERSRAEYAAHHLGADMDFLQTMSYRLEGQSGDTIGDLAWVASESRMTGTANNQRVDLLSTETLVLRKKPDGWKVVHVHWSSRAAGK